MDVNDLNAMLKHVGYLRDNGVKRLIVTDKKVEIEFIEKIAQNMVRSAVINQELGNEKGQSSTDSDYQEVNLDLYHVD